jgi:hypothetical protein
MVEVRSVDWDDPAGVAVRFYTREGYEPIPRFGYYVDSADSLCFAKSL